MYNKHEPSCIRSGETIGSKSLFAEWKLRTNGVEFD